jgi:GNAT superfamily N-acetyltransferase
MESYMLKNLTSADEIRSSFRVFTILRPHLDEETFVAQALRQMEQGYIITAILDDDLVVSTAGYRYSEALAWGKFIYIDDLVTHPDARGKGYGGQLLEHVKQLAIDSELDAVHLDSGHTRFDAHRVYLNHGFQIKSHHFSVALKDKS